MVTDAFSVLTVLSPLLLTPHPPACSIPLTVGVPLLHSAAPFSVSTSPAFPPLSLFSLLSLSDLFLSVTLSYFSSGSSSLLVSYLPLLFETIDIHMKGQTNVTLHLVGFRQILPASGALKKCLSWGRGQWRADF